MRVAIGVWLLAALLAGCALADDMDERIPVEPGGRLEVDLDLGQGLRPDPGSLEVVSHDANEVWILADASGWGASGVRFRVDQGEHAVRLLGRVEGAFSWMFGGPKIQVRILIPREFSVDLRCTAGPIRITDVTGRVRARTSDAAVEVEGAEGSVKLRTADGDLRVSEVVGDVEVKTSAGDIEMSWITGDVEARTGDGHIDLAHVEGHLAAQSDWGPIEIRDVNGTVEAKGEQGSIFVSFAGEPAGALETSRGTVRAVIPADAGVEIDAISRRGSVEVAPGLSVPGDQSEKRVSGPINGGGRSLRLYTARGTVRVGRR
jgi:hypothetical protein